MDAAPVRDRARIRIKASPDDLQQCRLTVSVTAHDADPLTFVNTYGEVVENFFVRPLVGNVLETDENPHYRAPSSANPRSIAISFEYPMRSFGVSRIIGRPKRRVFVTTAANAAFPICPSPIFSWRSL